MFWSLPLDVNGLHGLVSVPERVRKEGRSPRTGEGRLLVEEGSVHAQRVLLSYFIAFLSPA